MKVIIIGAGLSGLSTAISLRKYIPSTIDEALEVKIYDKAHVVNDADDEKDRGRRRRLGAGLGLQSNGLRVLNDLDPKLGGQVYASGFPCTHFKWKTSGDVLLGREYVDVLPISRPFLIDRLLESLPTSLVENKTVTKVVACEGKKPILYFTDGIPPETADLVVGADGIRSVVREGMFGDDEKYRPRYLYKLSTTRLIFLTDQSIVEFVGWAEFLT